MREIIAALDLGTSKSVALVAQKYLSGKLSLMQTETIVSKNAIRRGRIYNSDETAEIITKLIWKLNNNPNMLVEKIYVGIGGQSIRTQQFSVKKFVEGGAISQQLLDTLRDEALNYQPEFEENLGIISREYYADGHLISTPRGALASIVEARFLLIVGNPCLKRNLDSIFNKEGISVAGYFISPFATAQAVLTPEEKESGCALIELGEGVTYISVYKNKNLKYMITIPLGGLAITKDIRCLNVQEEEAEELKIRYGSAIPKQDNDEPIPVHKEQNLSWNINIHDLNMIIGARIDEIVKNISKHIQEYVQELNSGIVITGGGALLRELPQFIKNETGKEVRLAQAKVLINQTETLLSPANSCVVGLATLGSENCVIVKKEKEKEKEIEKENGKKFSIIEEIKKEIEGKGEDQTEDPTKKSQPKGEEIIKDPINAIKDFFDNKVRQKVKQGAKKGAKIINNMELALFKDSDFYNDTTNPVEDETNVTKP